MVAHSTKSRKSKARELQNRIRDDLIANFPPLGSADISPAIMGSSGMDILLSTRAREILNFAFEAKNQESLNIWSALKQCEANAEKEGLLPLLVFKRARTDVYAAIRWVDLLDLMKRARK